MKGGLRQLIYRFFPLMFFRPEPLIYRHLVKNPTILVDIGCGVGKTIAYLLDSDVNLKLQGTYLVGLDLWKPYLIYAKRVFHDVVRCDANLLPLREGSTNVVIATDLIEHLWKRDGLKFLNKVETIAQMQVFMFTPVGHNFKSLLEDNNPYQAHLSFWVPEEFATRKYKVYGLNGLRNLRGERFDYRSKNPILEPLLMLLCLISQFFTYRLAKAAYHMLCVKNMNDIS